MNPVDSSVLDNLMGQHSFQIRYDQEVIVYKALRMTESGLLVSLLGESPVGLTYKYNQWEIPPITLGPLVAWSAPHFFQKREGVQLWECRGWVDLLDKEVPYLLLPVFLKKIENAINFWDKMRRFGHDLRYDYFSDKKKGLMPREYGSVLVKKIKLTRRIL